MSFFEHARGMLVPALEAYAAELGLLSAVSLLVFAGSLALAPWLVRRVSDRTWDALEAGHLPPPGAHPWRWRTLRNLLGIALLVGGLAMLVLPGQGLLTLGVGLMLVSFPGKRALLGRLLRWRVAQGLVRRVHRVAVDGRVKMS